MKQQSLVNILMHVITSSTSGPTRLVEHMGHSQKSVHETKPGNIVGRTL